jgi:hypothetical protein
MKIGWNESIAAWELYFVWFSWLRRMFIVWVEKPLFYLNQANVESI